MRKNTIRIQMSGPKEAQECLQIIKKKQFLFLSSEVCAFTTDTLFIKLCAEHRGAQLAWLLHTLNQFGNWEIVGPVCAGRGDIPHEPRNWNMVCAGSKVTRFGWVWRCFERKCMRQVEHTDYDFMNYREFNAELHTSAVDRMMDAPIGEPKTCTEQVVKAWETVNGPNKNGDSISDQVWNSAAMTYHELQLKLDSSKPNLPGQIPRGPSKRYREDALKMCVGANYAELEVSILAAMLQMKVPEIRQMNSFYDNAEAAKALSDGNALMLTENGMDRVRLDTILTKWGLDAGRKNVSKTLLVLELDGQYVRSEITGAATVKQLAAVIVDKFWKNHENMNHYRQAAKPFGGFSGAAISAQQSLESMARSNLELGKKVKELEGQLDLAVAERAGYKAALELLQAANSLEKTEDNEVTNAADDMLRFLAGLNFQDHPVADQRMFNDKFQRLKKALNAAKEKKLNAVTPERPKL